jgi:hypothetical protein
MRTIMEVLPGANLSIIEISGNDNDLVASHFAILFAKCPTS